MGQGIQDFYTVAQKFNFARDYQFRVTQLSKRTSGDGTMIGDLLVYARTASIPTRKLITKNVAYKGFNFNVPMGVEYDSGSWPVTFYCDQIYVLRGAFEYEQKSDFNEHNMSSFLQNRVLQLNLLDDAMNTIMIYKLHGWFVQNLGDIKYDIGGNGAPLTFTAELCYQYWTSEIVEAPAAASPGLLQKLGGTIQTINNVVKGVKNVGSMFKG